MSFINHHPSDQQLHFFANGEIDEQMGVLISSHVFSCDHCKSRLRDIEAQITNSSFFDESIGQHSWMNSMASEICKETKPAPTQVEKVSDNDCVFNIGGKSVELITPLQKLQSRIKKWWHTPSAFSVCSLDVPGDGNLFFVYFKKGSSVPQHSHSGSEYNLVVAGSFSDGHNTYQTGDFAEFTQDHSHAPQTDDEFGCLILTKLNGQFKFESGWSKLLNPVQKLFMK